MTSQAGFQSCLAQFRSPDPAARREAAQALAECDRRQAVDPLVEGLKDENPGVQEAAMIALIRIGGTRVVSSLVPLLREDAATRSLAAEVLGQTGGSALELLLPLVGHPDSNLRKVIVDTLGKLGDARSISSLIAALKDADANVRGAAAEALARLQAQEAVPELLKLLDDEEWVLFSVVEALGRIGAPAAIPRLMELLRTGSEPVQYAVIEALGHFSDAAGCIRPMLLDLVPSANPVLRDLLIKSVVNLTTSCAMDLRALVEIDAVLPTFCAAVQSDDEVIVKAAIRGLGLLEDRRGTVPILGALEGAHTEHAACAEDLAAEAKWALVRCPDEAALISSLGSPVEEVVRVAAETLGTLRSRGAVSALSNLMSHPDREVRRTAIQALGMIGDSLAISVVIGALEDETGHVRAEAATVLGKWADRLGIDPLCRRLLVEPYPDVRATIVDALCSEPDPLVAGRLIAVLDHEREEVRASAAKGLAKLRAPEAFRPLMETVNDPSASVRAAVIEALGGYQVKPALEAILLALSDDDEHVRVAAVLALAGWDQPEAERALIVEGLGDQDLWVRYRAAEVLGGKRTRGAVPALLEIAKTAREPAVLRKMAVEALGRIGDSRTKEVISDLMWDCEAEVSAAAAEALDFLEGGGEGDDPWK